LLREAKALERELLANGYRPGMPDVIWVNQAVADIFDKALSNKTPKSDQQ
jgi:hypothetical protein